VQLAAKYQWSDRTGPVVLNSPAAAARQAFDLRPGDVVVAATDPDNPGQLKDLSAVRPDDPASRQQNTFELSQRWLRLAGQPLVMQVRRQGTGPSDPLEEVRPAPAEFAWDDVIVATTDPDDPGRVTPLPPDEHNPGSGLGDYFALERRLQRLAGQFLTVRVRRVSGEEVNLMVPPAYHYTVGARMTMGEVAGVREDSPAQRSGVSKGNILQEVILTDAAGKSQRFVTAHKKDENADDLAHFVDPVRLPYELRQWATGRTGVTATLIVFRGDPRTREERGKPQRLPPVEWDGSDRWLYDKERPLNPVSPMAIPELGLAYRVETTVDKGSSAGGEQLEDDDVIKEVRFSDPGKKPGTVEKTKWLELKSDNWARNFFDLQVVEFKDVSLKVERKKKVDGRKGTETETKELELMALPDGTWPLSSRGFLFKEDTFTVQAANFGQAVLMGLHDTHEQILDVFHNVRNMIGQRISAKNMSGPIGIAVLAYRVASVDFWEFIFFLGMISVNLAVLNFLPIPVLDGGHMVFLIYEKLRGRPATEQVRIAATYVGLLLIVSLMFFVFYLDIFTRGWF
jgi:regulator of sigma E protease